MYTLLSYSAGLAVEGVIVTHTQDRMRVFAAGFPDTLELRRSGSRWMTEDGEEVQFEFLAAEAPAAGEISSPAAAQYRAGSSAS